MDTNLRRQAQRRADRIALFRAELAELEEEQALTAIGLLFRRLRTRLLERGQP